jgi:hypothetical protein
MQEPQQEKQPIAIAQNTSPQTPAPVSNEEKAPAGLPKSASMNPLIGVSGLILLGVYSLLRLKRSV